MEHVVLEAIHGPFPSLQSDVCLRVCKNSELCSGEPGVLVHGGFAIGFDSLNVE